MTTQTNPVVKPQSELPVLGADRFEILERIGAGGMGTVYKAIQKSVGRHVAVKVLSSEYASNAAGVARFVREATVVSRLVHPNIVSMIEFGRDPEDNLLLVMELLEGEPLRTTVRRVKRLPVWRAVQISLQVLAALRVAHAAGVVHRDLKPENIFVCSVDGADHAKVLDFGVAKMLQHDVGIDTTAGSMVGTLKYMAPEHIAGDPPDARVDLYALGMLLYEMLAGTLPYDYKERVALLRAILNEPPVPLLNKAPDVPGPLAEIVMRAISKMPSERFQTADAFRDALKPFAMYGHGAVNPLFSMTSEIRLPSSRSLPVIPVDSPSDESTKAATPGAISNSGPHGRVSSSSGISAISAHSGKGDPAGILAPPPNPSGTSGVNEFGIPRADSSHNAHNPYILPMSVPGTSVPPPEYTTGAGLSSASSASNTSSPTQGKRSGLIIGSLVLVGLAATTLGVVIAKYGVSSPRNRLELQHQSSSTGTAVVVQSTPEGAEVRDIGTNEILCTHTPCGVPVAGGHLRRVRVSVAGRFIDALLDPSISPMNVNLQGPSTAPNTGGLVEHGTVSTPPIVDAGTRRNNRPRLRPDQTIENNNSVPMFGRQPGT